MYPDLPGNSRIFNLGTKAFAREYLKGESRIFHVSKVGDFGKNVHEGGANGTAFSGVAVRQGVCRGRYYHGFKAIIVNKTTGEVLTEEERSRYGASQCGSLSNTLNPTLGLKNSLF